jgi:hypothetical protein
MRKVQYFAIVGLIVAGMLSGTRTVSANGEEFFELAGNGPINLAYFGLIRDSAGKPLDHLEVWIQTSIQVFSFSNDSPGHFRSPDVGTYFKDTGEVLDPSSIKIMVSKPGYEQVWRDVPKKSEGAIQMNIVLLRTGETAPVAGGGPFGGRGWIVPLLLVGVVGLITAGAVRTSIRRPSTDDSSHAAA